MSLTLQQPNKPHIDWYIPAGFGVIIFLHGLTVGAITAKGQTADHRDQWEVVCGPMKEDLGDGHIRVHYTGVWVSSSHWMTAKHCTEGDSIPQEFTTDEGSIAKLVYVTDQQDGPAIFEVTPARRRTVMRFSGNPPKLARL